MQLILLGRTHNLSRKSRIDIWNPLALEDDLVMEFNVLNHYTGRYFTVKEHEIILDAELRQGEALPYSCRNGYCWTCKAKLIISQIN